ncbi:hypothetical protein BRD00_11145 [Halobacteriales archaeon QS_8_69_26]|nr:MAG: hypothetical protein BRD00_11145 [Halobacteriales archaeon QS_8_69_26]
MGATYADLRNGVRHDIEVTFVTRRSLDVAGERVHKVALEDVGGRQFAALIAPSAGPLLDLKTGGTYRVESMLVSAPPTRPGPDAPDCPACGAPLREGKVADTTDEGVIAAVSAFGIEKKFGIIDEETTVTRVDRDENLVDDWRPRNEDRRSRGRRSVNPPDYVCDSCGRHVDAHELRDQRRRPDRHEHEDAAAPSSGSPGRALHSVEANMDASAAGADPASTETVGMATGGAKDVGNFRENVENEYTPQPEAIADEGLFYDYHFETGEGADSDALFAPRYATAVSEHPLTGETERFLSVGLDSTLSVEDFERLRLDLVAVLDVSGSMSSAFDSYYYDEHGNRCSTEGGAETKMEAATEALCALTQQLRADDRLGIVLYNSQAHVAKPLRDVGSTDMDAIRRHVREVSAGGGTNLAAGFRAAADLLDGGTTTRNIERRIVFMTDMMPNTGTTGESALTELFADAATEGIHTTFVGIGLDANADLAETLSGIRGANHYFVHSGESFERRLGEEFEYTVSPLVYDLGLELDAEGYEIAAVHGSPSADAATDRLMHVGTLFPSPKEEGKARGGVVLVRLASTGNAEELDLVASWTERAGDEHVERVSVTVPEEPETFDHTGIRKAVALSRYARELWAWATAVHGDEAGGVDDWEDPDPDPRGRHERGSVPLSVSPEHADRFGHLRDYLEAEMAAVGDEDLQQELDLLATLCAAAPSTATEVEK